MRNYLKNVHRIVMTASNNLTGVSRITVDDPESAEYGWKRMVCSPGKVTMGHLGSWKRGKINTPCAMLALVEGEGVGEKDKLVWKLYRHVYKIVDSDDCGDLTFDQFVRTDVDCDVYNEILFKIKTHPSQTRMRPSHEFHEFDTVEHIELVVDAADRLYVHDEEVRVLAMFHDLGKFETGKQNEECGWTFHKHDAKSAEIARAANVPEYLCRIIESHSWLYNVHEVKKKYDETGKLTAVKRFMFNLVKDLDDPLDLVYRSCVLYGKLAMCDIAGFSEAGMNQRLKDLQVWEELVTAAAPEVEDQIKEHMLDRAKKKVKEYEDKVDGIEDHLSGAGFVGADERLTRASFHRGLEKAREELSRVMKALA